MKVSRKAEYACVALLELAAHYGDAQPVRIKTIADANQIPQRFLVQILLQLKSAGLVASVRGASGGYQLARSPDKISIAQAINAIDSQPEARKTEQAPRDTPAWQAVASVQDEVGLAERRILEQTSFAELVRRTLLDNSLSYQI